MKMTYPVNKLNRNITHFLNDVVSADILGSVGTGLKSQIELIDDGDHITDFASIVYNSLDKTSSVRLSMAYGQFLWLLCDVALKILDRNVIVDECAKNGISLQTFLESTIHARQMTESQITPYLPPSAHVSCQGYMSYLALVPQLLADDFWQKMEQEYAAAMSLMYPDTPVHADYIKSINISGPYEERTNSVYCYAIAFLLLHEQAHHALQHMNKVTDAQDEENADMTAFWSIYVDINDDRRISANAAIMCAFFSFLVYDPQQKMLNDHPADYRRLFNVYDMIRDENPKYTQLLVGLLDFWAKTNSIKNYPLGLPYCDESVARIKEFFNQNY